MSGEFLLYQAPDGSARIQLRVSDGTVWLSQRQLAELYQVSVPTINGHLRTIFRDGELPADRTIRKFRIVAREACQRRSEAIRSCLERRVAECVNVAHNTRTALAHEPRSQPRMSGRTKSLPIAVRR